VCFLKGEDERRAVRVNIETGCTVVEVSVTRRKGVSLSRVFCATVVCFVHSGATMRDERSWDHEDNSRARN